MLKYLRDKLAGRASGPNGAIMAYRGGYLPETRRRDRARPPRRRDPLRRRHERARARHRHRRARRRRLRRLPGLDRRHLAALRPRGPARRASIAVLVASSAPLDQYLARAPGDLFDAPVEEARIDPHNAEILIQHLKCAAFELPFARREGEALRARVCPRTTPRDALALPRAITASCTSPTGRFHWAADAYPGQPRLACAASAGTTSSSSTRRRGSAIAELDWRVDAHHAARAGHLPARRRAVPGRAARLREPQGLRHQGRARLLHDRDDQPQGQRSSRRARRARSAVHARRGARCRSSRR